MRKLLLPALVLAVLPAATTAAEPDRAELERKRQPQCDAAYAQAKAEAEAGGKLPRDELWWSLDYVNAKAGRKAMGEVCARVPAALLARVNTGTAALDAIPYDTTSPDGVRWKQLWDELRARPVGEALKFGIIGSTTVVIGEPSELERLSVKLGGRNLMRFGQAYQFRSSANIAAFCAAFPGPDCQKQRESFSLAWAAKQQREAKPREFAAVPEKQPAASWTALPPSATVMVRAYDARGNYLGSTVTTRTDAALMGAR